MLCLEREFRFPYRAMRTAEKWCSKWCSKIQKRRGTFLRSRSDDTCIHDCAYARQAKNRNFENFGRNSRFLRIPANRLWRRIRERKEAAPRATRPANATITHFAEFWPGLYYRTSVNMGSVKFQTPGDTVLARPWTALSRAPPVFCNILANPLKFCVFLEKLGTVHTVLYVHTYSMNVCTYSTEFCH